MSRSASCPNPHKGTGGQAVSLCFEDLPKSDLLSGPVPLSLHIFLYPFLCLAYIACEQVTCAGIVLAVKNQLFDTKFGC